MYMQAAKHLKQEEAEVRKEAKSFEWIQENGIRSEEEFAGPIGPGRVRSRALSLRSLVFIALSFS